MAASASEASVGVNAGAAYEQAAATPLIAGSVRRPRIAALDFTKGALVLIMVLYHWINYFIGPDWPWYFYLRFLTPSFILVSGFVISNVYLGGDRPIDGRLVKRLISRGAKLLALFAVLNIFRGLLLHKALAAGGAGAVLHSGFFFEVFVSGNVSTATGKIVAFYILVPISYLLVLSGALIPFYRSFRYSFHVACGVLLVGIVLLAVEGTRSYNLEFVAIGFMGIVLGYGGLDRVNRWVAHAWVLAVAYGGYLAAITFWNVPFALLVPGVILSVGIIYRVGLGADEPNRLQQHVILLGKYSLFGYVGQIAILQVLSAVFHHFPSDLAVLGISFVTAFALTSLAVEALDRARMKSAVCDHAYKLVFA